MSDAMAKEAKWQNRLAKAYKDLIITVAFGVIGTFVFFLGLNYWGAAGNTLVELLGFLIIGAPIVLKAFFSGFGDALFFWRDYEVITTYSDGSKKSDGGAESAQMNFFGMVFGALLAVILGVLITVAKAAWLTIKSITSYLAVKEKPGFLKSPFLIVILGWVALLGAAWLGSHLEPPVHDKIIAIEPKQAVVEYDYGNPPFIYERPNGVLGTNPRVIQLERGDVVTIVGEEVENVNGTSVPVEYEGKTGWIDPDRLNMDTYRVTLATAPEKIDALMPTIDSLMTPVNISSKPKDKKPSGIDWGSVTIHSIAYLDDFTVLKISNSEWDIKSVAPPDRGNEGTYFIQDAGADSSIPYTLMAGRPWQTPEGKTGQYLFFRPFAAKYFHLVNTGKYRNSIPSKESIDSGEAIVSGEHVLYVRIPE